MVERGCGSRKGDGLYCCVEPSPYGYPIEHFLVDPCIPFELPEGENIRSPYFLEDPVGVHHLVMGVGSTYYPFVTDFIEEARQYGISKRLPKNFDYRKLDPDKSNLILIHKRAIPDFSYALKSEDYAYCPRLLGGRFRGDQHNTKYKNDLVEVGHPNLGNVLMARHQCLGDNWALSSALSVDEKHELEELPDGDFKVTTPSVSYRVEPAYTQVDGERITWVDNSQYMTGIFLRFPHFHFEYVRSQKAKSEKEQREYAMTLKKIREVYVDKGFGFRVCDE